VKFSDLTRRDSDAAFRARMLLAAAWALFAGAGIGGALGYLLVERTGLSGGAGVAVALLVMAAMTGAVLAVALLSSEVAGRAASGLLHPGGGRPRSDHSLPRSLLARGLVEEAVRAFEVAVATDPTDPEPYLEIARIERDRLARPEEALGWFRRARDQARLGPGEARVLIREIAELARKHLRDPARAAPDLARHLAAHEGTPEGEWARAELAELKKGIGRSQAG
jgi:tetratricopeptide (TPR) repeat protein